MRTPEDRRNAIPQQMAAIAYIADFERCDDIRQLHVVMDEINRCQYQLISVTQDSNDIYTVFFRRCVLG